MEEKKLNNKRKALDDKRQCWDEGKDGAALLMLVALKLMYGISTNAELEQKISDLLYR